VGPKGRFKLMIAKTPCPTETQDIAVLLSNPLDIPRTFLMAELGNYPPERAGLSTVMVEICCRLDHESIDNKAS
jgi:hypothetical protein